MTHERIRVFEDPPEVGRVAVHAEGVCPLRANVLDNNGVDDPCVHVVQVNDVFKNGDGLNVA